MVYDSITETSALLQKWKPPRYEWDTNARHIVGHIPILGIHIYRHCIAISKCPIAGDACHGNSLSYENHCCFGSLKYFGTNANAYTGMLCVQTLIP